MIRDTSRTSGRHLRAVSLIVYLLMSFELFAQQIEKKGDHFSGKTVQNVDEAMSVILGRANNAPHVGELAPDFRLRDSTATKMVSLYDLCKKGPVVLFFGSGTCGVTCGRAMDMKGLAESFGKKATFVMIYVREAHPRDGFSVKPFSVIDDPVTIEKRTHAAASWKKQFKIPFQILVDDMKDTTAARWASWPVRLFVISNKRKIVYAGAPGPWYCKPVKNYEHKVKAPPEVSTKGFNRGSLEEFLETYLPPESVR